MFNNYVLTFLAMWGTLTLSAQNANAPYASQPDISPRGVDFLVNFQAAPQEEAVRLFWQAEPVAADWGFIVQRSNDGSQWHDLDFVPARKDAPTYSFTDPSPLPGYNHYRLVREAVDGSRSISLPRGIHSGSETLALDVSQAAGSDMVTVRMPAEATSFSLHNAGGRELLRGWVQNRQPVIGIQLMPFWPDGTYYLRVPAGEVLYSAMVIKGKR